MSNAIFVTDLQNVDTNVMHMVTGYIEIQL